MRYLTKWEMLYKVNVQQNRKTRRNMILIRDYEMICKRKFGIVL